MHRFNSASICDSGIFSAPDGYDPHERLGKIDVKKTESGEESCSVTHIIQTYINRSVHEHATVG